MLNKIWWWYLFAKKRVFFPFYEIALPFNFFYYDGKALVPENGFMENVRVLRLRVFTYGCSDPFQKAWLGYTDHQSGTFTFRRISRSWYNSIQCCFSVFWCVSHRPFNLKWDIYYHKIQSTSKRFHTIYF